MRSSKCRSFRVRRRQELLKPRSALLSNPSYGSSPLEVPACAGVLFLVQVLQVFTRLSRAGSAYYATRTSVSSAHTAPRITRRTEPRGPGQVNVVAAVREISRGPASGARAAETCVPRPRRLNFYNSCKARRRGGCGGTNHNADLLV